jgi:probable HAF family extracellular repeat protein
MCRDDQWVCTTDCAGRCVERPVWTGVPRYVIISLRAHNAWIDTALGINDHGQVVGRGAVEGQSCGYLWDSGTARCLETPPGATLTEPWDINNVGQVVGTAFGYTRSRGRAFLWEEGQEAIDLGDLGGGEASALAINDQGMVVGYSAVSYWCSQAFLWEGDVMVPIPSAFGGSSSTAWDINDAGQVVGVAATASLSARAFLWQDGVMQDLGTLGGNYSYAKGVNDLGAVTGNSQRELDDDGVTHAFLWDAGQMTDLGLLGGFLGSRAGAINDRGQVVGSASRGGPWLGFLYDPESGVSDLDSLVSPNRGWVQLLPRDINDAGQIIGEGTLRNRKTAFLMTPLDTDFDDNGQTGLEDYAVFHDCLTGPGIPVDDSCRACDVDRDGAVDLRDTQYLQWAFGGF